MIFKTKRYFEEELNRRMDEEWRRKEFYDMRDKLDFLERRVKDLTLEVEDLVKYIKDRNSDTKSDTKEIKRFSNLGEIHQ